MSFRDPLHFVLGQEQLPISPLGAVGVNDAAPMRPICAIDQPLVCLGQPAVADVTAGHQLVGRWIETKHPLATLPESLGPRILRILQGTSFDPARSADRSCRRRRPCASAPTADQSTVQIGVAASPGSLGLGSGSALGPWFPRPRICAPTLGPWTRDEGPDQERGTKNQGPTPATDTKTALGSNRDQVRSGDALICSLDRHASRRHPRHQPSR